MEIISTCQLVNWYISIMIDCIKWTNWCFAIYAKGFGFSLSLKDEYKSTQLPKWVMSYMKKDVHKVYA